jgi:hypothetical protein
MKLAGHMYWLRLLLNFPIFDVNVEVAMSVIRTCTWDLFPFFTGKLVPTG